MKTINVVAMGILLTNLCFMSNPSKADAQKQTPRYQTINSNSNGFYEYLPQGYESETQTYPLLVFLHGIGELGDGSANSLQTVLRNGPPKLINEGTFPVSFTVNGEVFKFIVISPQFINWPVPDDVQAVIDYAVKNYRVNSDRIYVTGLSMGGGVVWDYGAINLDYANRVAAIVPVCGASSSTPDKVKVMVSANLPVWATHNQDDPSVPTSNTINYVNDINSYSPAPVIPARQTIFPVSGHDAWTTTYSINFKENNLNVYEWMLQYKRGAGQPAKAEIPAAGLPGKVEAENYTNMRGVQTENTIDTGGGKDIGFIDAGDWLDYDVNAASAGNYSINFRVAGTSAGQVQLLSAKGDVLTTVDLPSTGDFQKWKTVSGKVDLPAGKQTLRVYASKGGWNINWTEFGSTNQSIANTTIPGRIEAEKYDAMYGIDVENTADVGGGQNVGWIATGEWMDYKTSVATAGNYTVNLRLATPFDGQQLQLRNSSGAVLGTLNIPKTGNYQSWITASMVVNLPSGDQTLRVYSLNGSYNINWFEFVTGGTTTSMSIPQSINIAEDLKKDAFLVFPNPVREKFLLEMNNSQLGTVEVKVADQSGKIVKSLKFEKTQQESQFNIPANELSPGIYFINVQIGYWKESKKLVKM